jgi:hypothetical protein
MKKDFFLITAAAFFILAYVLDYLAGPVPLALKQTNPFSFLSRTYLNDYPLTAVAVVIRALGLLIAVVLLFTLAKKHYAVKSLASLIVGILAELYAIQQIATGMRTTSLQWTLSIAYAGAGLAILVIIYLFAGIGSSIKTKLIGEDDY